LLQVRLFFSVNIIIFLLEREHMCRGGD
jgi:hypothetical protein